MDRTRNRLAIVAMAPIAAIVLAAANAANAAPAGPAAADAAKAQYDAERARCMSGNTGQDQASCLKSAGAAYDASRQNRLNDAGNYKANALDRCRNLPASDRADCEARIDGPGTTSGSVKDGGILRETVTPVPADGATAPPVTR